MIEAFFCQYCMKSLENEAELKWHEQSHTPKDISDFISSHYCFNEDLDVEKIFEENKKLLNQNKDCILCPDCKGVGGHEQTDPYDWRYCYFCGGKKIIKANVMLTYRNAFGDTYYHNKD